MLNLQALIHLLKFSYQITPSKCKLKEYQFGYLFCCHKSGARADEGCLDKVYNIKTSEV